MPVYVAVGIEVLVDNCADNIWATTDRFPSIARSGEFVEWHIYLRWIDSLGSKGRIVRAKKVIGHIGDSRETVHTAELAIDAFLAEPIAH